MLMVQDQRIRQHEVSMDVDVRDEMWLMDGVPEKNS